jgi:hypothetical protein
MDSKRYSTHTRVWNHTSNRLSQMNTAIRTIQYLAFIQHLIFKKKQSMSGIGTINAFRRKGRKAHTQFV